VSSRLPRLVTVSITGPLVALLMSSVIIALTTDRFLDINNLQNLSLQVSIVAIIAIGSTLVILTGGIDLSPGSQVAVLTMLLATFVKTHGQPLGLAIPEIIVVGGGLGLINGILVAYGRIPSFIVTLGTLTAYKGWAFLFNNGSPIFSVSDTLTPIFYDKWLGVPRPLYYVVVLYLVSFIFLNFTLPGRAIYAAGGNEVAARLSGINVQRVRVLAFTLAGCTAGMASVLMTARLNSGSPNYGAGFELQAIGAAVIGGASLVGGYGNILSTLLGALTIVVVQNGLNLNDVPTSWQQIVLGIIIIFAVGVDSWKTQIASVLRRILPAGWRSWVSRRAPPRQAATAPVADGRGNSDVTDVTGPRREE
jgi:ribose transport system permease protein